MSLSNDAPDFSVISYNFTWLYFRNQSLKLSTTVLLAWLPDLVLYGFHASDIWKVFGYSSIFLDDIQRTEFLILYVTKFIIVYIGLANLKFSARDISMACFANKVIGT